jgi:hypothetical protein
MKYFGSIWARQNPWRSLFLLFQVLRNKRIKFIAAFASRRLSYALYKGAGLHLTVRFHVNSIHTSIGVDQVGSVGENVHHSGVFVDQQ